MADDPKSALRAAALAARRGLDPAERTALSRAIAGRLYDMPVWGRARSVHLFIGAVDGEVETREIATTALAENRRVYCPRVRRSPLGLDAWEIRSLDELEEGPRGLWEPDRERARLALPGEPFDLVLVPGLVFDRAGARIGYGAGFYDRFLAETEAPRVALAFSLQLVDRVPAEDHDQSMDWLVTERETIDCHAPSAPVRSGKDP